MSGRQQAYFTVCRGRYRSLILYNLCFNNIIFDNDIQLVVAAVTNFNWIEVKVNIFFFAWHYCVCEVYTDQTHSVYVI